MRNYNDLMPESELIGVCSIAVTVVAFYSYHYLTQFKIVPAVVKRIYPGINNQEVLDFLSAKLTGFLFLGLLPLIFLIIFFPVSLPEIGLTWGNTGKFWYLLISVPVVAAAVMSFTSKNPKNQSVYPQMRLKTWTSRYLFTSFAGWTIYLVSYEFLFRGILWFLCFAAFGFWPALVINLALYSALHLPKGIGETMGAIPLGALVCLFTWLTGSIFLAFLTHISIAASSEFFSIYHNPDMHFQTGFKKEK